jgi:hypothetical protein
LARPDILASFPAKSPVLYAHLTLPFRLPDLPPAARGPGEQAAEDPAEAGKGSPAGMDHPRGTGWMSRPDTDMELRAFLITRAGQMTFPLLTDTTAKALPNDGRVSRSGCG